MKRLLNIVQLINGTVHVPSYNTANEINYAYYISKELNNYEVGTLLRDSDNKLYIVTDNRD